MTPGVPNAKRFALIPRAVVVHRMENSDCLDSRLFWAGILWSWCGVEVSPDGAVVLKDQEGWLKKDTKGRPIYAKLKDLCELLGLAPAMMGNLSRAAARLVEVGSWRFGDSIPGCKGSKAKIVYPVQEPPSRKELQVVSTDNLKVWHIGTQVVSTDNFKHLDQVACAELQAELDGASTTWLLSLKAARTQADALLVQILSRRGILIENSKSSRLAKPQPPAGQPVLASSVPEPHPTPPPTPPPDPPPAPPPEEAKPAGWPEGLVSDNESLKPQIKTHLEQFRIARLTNETVNEVAKHITSPELLEQFKEATSHPTKSPPRTWGLIITIAKEVAQDGERYRQAVAAGNGHSPPKRKSDAIAERIQKIREGQSHAAR